MINKYCYGSGISKAMPSCEGMIQQNVKGIE
jgi:hypothetical protein